MAKVARTQIVEERVHALKAGARKEAKEQKGGKGERRTCWTCGTAGHIAASCPTGGCKNLYAIGGKENDDNDEELQAWA